MGCFRVYVRDDELLQLLVGIIVNYDKDPY